jgi:transcriptional regulator with XRE-family HTH domain
MCSIAMAHPAYLRDKARELRIERKLSLLEIAERLALPKTTVFYWIRDLSDPEIKYRDSPARAGPGEGRASQRDAAYQRGWDEYPILAEEPTFVDFVCASPRSASDRRLQAWMDRTQDQWLDSICRGV